MEILPFKPELFKESKNIFDVIGDQYEVDDIVYSKRTNHKFKILLIDESIMKVWDMSLDTIITFKKHKIGLHLSYDRDSFQPMKQPLKSVTYRDDRFCEGKYQDSLITITDPVFCDSSGGVGMPTKGGYNTTVYQLNF